MLQSDAIADVLTVLQGNFINNDPQMVPPGTQDWGKVTRPTRVLQ